MAACYFRTNGLSVGYHGVPLLEDITVEVHKGEILTLIGPNGAGKSTLLKSIAGQLQRIAGCVYLDKRELSGMGRQELARQMAVVFTDKMYTEMMSCEDVVAGGRYPYTGRFGVLSEPDRRVVDECMDMTRVSDIRGRDYNKISDGQRQRVLLARALCQQPEIILLDEPVSYLDVRYKLEFLSTLQQLTKKRGLSVIMSLHELDLAQRVSDKLLCIGKDQVERFGTPEEIFCGGYICRLFGVEKGSYEEGGGTMELEAPQGKPRVFVLAGGGSGREVYHRLQREGIPFATGIMHMHDLDYPVAQALAAAVVAAPGMEPMGEIQLREAKRLADGCGEVVLCREQFGGWEEANVQLWRYVQEKGYRIISGFDR